MYVMISFLSSDNNSECPRQGAVYMSRIYFGKLSMSRPSTRGVLGAVNVNQGNQKVYRANFVKI